MASPDLVNLNMFIQKGKPFPKKLDRKGTKGLVTTESLAGYSKYTARADASVVNEESMELSPGGYFKYSSERQGSTRTYTNEGWKDSPEEMKVFRNYVAKHFAEDGDIAWLPVQSFKDYATSSQYGLFKDEDYAQVIEKSLESFFDKAGLNKSNMIWWMNYHTNKDHPHVHLVFLEKEKTRTKGTFTQEELKYFKRAILTNMMDRERLLNKTQETFKENFKDIDGMKHNLSLLGKQTFHEMKSIELEDAVNKLYDVLPSSGRLQYGSSQMIPYREQLDKIVDDILNHKAVKPELEKCISKWDELDRVYETRLHEQSSNLKDSEVQKIRKQIANEILRTFKKEKTTELRNYEDSLSLKESVAVGESHEPVDLEVSDFQYRDEELNELKVNELKIIWDEPYKNALNLLYGTESVKQDVNKALEVLKKESEKGNVLATHDLGKAFSLLDKNSELVQPQYEKALNEFQLMLKKIDNNSNGFKSKKNEYAKSYLNYRLGKMFLYGMGTSKNYDLAREHLELCKDNRFALYTLGTMYQNGLGTDKDLELAKSYYLKSATMGNPYGSFSYANLIEKDGNKESVTYYQRALSGFKEMLEKNNDSNLHYKIGKILIDGKAGDVELEEGINHLMQAIEQGNERAMLEFVKSVEKNSLDLYREQAQEIKENLLSSFNQSMLLYEGFRLTESEDAEQIMEGVAYLMSMKDFKKNDGVCYRLFKSLKDTHPNEAITYLKLSAEQENINGMFTYARHLEEGNDLELSDLYYKKSLKSMTDKVGTSNLPAYMVNQIGYMYEQGKGVAVNPELALNYYVRNLETDDKALSNVARVVINNNLVNQFDFLQEYLKSKVESKYPTAMFWNARLLLNKDYKHYDYNKGRDMMIEASKLSDEPFIKRSGEYYQHQKSYRSNSPRMVGSALNHLKRASKISDKKLKEARDEYLKDGEKSQSIAGLDI